MRRVRSMLAVVGLFAAAIAPLASGGTPLVARAAPSTQHLAINCEYSRICPDVANSADVFGTDKYVGHDEPSNLFYSSLPGSGNRLSYDVTLPTDPSATNPGAPGKSFQFQLNGALWFGMALCDTQSYPEQVSTCPADSDSNIANNPDRNAPDFIGHHSGTAFVELQFYPPGWVPWPTWAVAVGASACDATKWCAAMNIFNLLEDPINGRVQNATCANRIGVETVNFAFVTRNGRTQAPPNPVDSTLATFTPDPQRDLFMNSGDHLNVSLRDTASGLRAVVNDLSTGQSGSMTASASNGFAQIQYDATGTSCNAIPFNFHPMYSTSSEETRVIWAAHTYNVAFSDEIGHFETCTGVKPIPATPFGVDAAGNPISCPKGNKEEFGAEPTDSDDNFCFPASEALRIHINGCTDTNTGFDGLDYTPVWPDGNTSLHPAPFLFSSPLTGQDFNVNYQRVAFEADLPRIEFNTCNRSTGVGCTLIPTTDDGVPASFYPFFSAVSAGGACRWNLGTEMPNTTNDFGKNQGWGTLLGSTYLAFGGGGSTVQRINNFRNVMSSNPCPA